MFGKMASVKQLYYRAALVGYTEQGSQYQGSPMCTKTPGSCQFNVRGISAHIHCPFTME